MDEYYHDRHTKTLSSAPTHPNVTEHKDGRITVSAYIKAHCFDGKEGPKVRVLSHAAKDFFDSRDSPEKAVSYFKSSRYPKGEQITETQYHDLLAQYKARLSGS